MRNSFVMVLFTIFAQGCALVKIGGVKSTERQEVSRKPIGDVQMVSLANIEPQLGTNGSLMLWVSGDFDKEATVTQRVVEYGNEWMAIGLFPGYDRIVNGYLDKIDEKKYSSGAYWIGMPLMNAVFVGIPTVCSIFEAFTSNSARAHTNDGIFPGWGIIGTLKYEGDKYEIKSYSEENVSIDRSHGPVLLKGYKVVVDGVELFDGDGVISIGKELKVGDQIRFKIMSIPTCPSGSQNYLSSILSVKFTATCR